MLMRIILLIPFIFFINLVFGQDMIVLQNGEEVKAKVIEITPQEVKYKRFDNLDGPVISIWSYQVFMVKYSNGSKDVIKSELTPTQLAEQRDSSALYYYNMGALDADEYFSCTNPTVATFSATLIGGPIGGLGAAIGIGSSIPKTANFTNGNPKLLDNAYYTRGYQHEAKKKKQQAVWRSFALGVFAEIMIITIIAVN